MSDRSDDSPVTWRELREAVADVTVFVLRASSEMAIHTQQAAMGLPRDETVPRRLNEAARKLEEKYKIDEIVRDA